MDDLGNHPAGGRGEKAALKADDLLARGTRTFQVSRCEVRANSGQLQVRIASRNVEKCGQRLRLDAQSVHARVDLHVHGPALLDPIPRFVLTALRPASPRRAAEPLQLTDVVDDRCQAFFQHLGVGVTVVGTQHQDRTGEARTAKLKTFLDQGNRKRVNQGCEHARHRHSAMSIGIRLDHAIDGHLRTYDGAHARDIATKGTQIDLRHRGPDRRAKISLPNRKPGGLRRAQGGRIRR